MNHAIDDLKFLLSISHTKYQKLIRDLDKSDKDNEKKEAQCKQHKKINSRLKLENERLQRDVHELRETMNERVVQPIKIVVKPKKIVIPPKAVVAAKASLEIGRPNGPISRYSGRASRSMSLHERDYEDSLPLKYIIKPSPRSSAGRFHVTPSAEPMVKRPLDRTVMAHFDRAKSLPPSKTVKFAETVKRRSERGSEERLPVKDFEDPKQKRRIKIVPKNTSDKAHTEMAHLNKVKTHKYIPLKNRKIEVAKELPRQTKNGSVDVLASKSILKNSPQASKSKYEYIPPAKPRVIPFALPSTSKCRMTPPVPMIKRPLTSKESNKSPTKMAVSKKASIDLDDFVLFQKSLSMSYMPENISIGSEVEISDSDMPEVEPSSNVGEDSEVAEVSDYRFNYIISETDDSD